MAEGGGEGFVTLKAIGADIEVWDKRTLKEKLGEASEGGVYRGNAFIYPLWKTLLNKWFSDENSKVYLVTPFLDEQRMKDVCRIILMNDADDRLENFYAREKCNNGKSLSELKNTVLDELKLDDNSKEMQKRVKKIYKKITGRQMFHAKFMCCVKGTEAEVFITSANFHGNHFDCNNLETVHYITTTEKKLKKKFLQKLM